MTHGVAFARSQNSCTLRVELLLSLLLLLIWLIIIIIIDMVNVIMITNITLFSNLIGLKDHVFPTNWFPVM